MTREDYFKWTGAERAEIEAAAATRNMTGQELVELLMGCNVQKLAEIDRQLGAPCNAVAAQVGGNVIQANFSAKAVAAWNDRANYQGLPDRRASGSRLRLLPIRVPSTSLNSHTAPVSSTSPDTGIPYSSR